MPSLPPSFVQATPDPLEAARMQALQTALGAKPNLDGVVLPKAAGTPGAQDNDPETRKLALLRGILSRDKEGQPGDPAAAAPVADLTGLGQFDAVNPHRWQSNAKIENPSRFVLRTGSVIPGVLISGVNSELPGTIIAQVSQNVYDTPTGQYLLLPQGSRLVGAYSSNVAMGRTGCSSPGSGSSSLMGALSTWVRNPARTGGGVRGVFGPGGQPLSAHVRLRDPALRRGRRRFIQPAARTERPGGDSNLNASAYSNNGLQQNLSQSLGNVFGNVIAQMIQKNLNVAPTIKIRPGYRFNVLVVKDFEMTPYQDFQYRLAK